MVVFRPFTSEVVVAKVKSSDQDRIRLTVGFFDDIYIPVAYLPQPSALYVPFHPATHPHTSSKANFTLNLNHTPHHPPSDPTDRAHFWLPDSPLDSSQTHELLDTPVTARMYLDAGEPVRVRVEADEFFDDEPGPPKMADGVQVPRAAGVGRAPYSVIVRY
ncbi:hypothetical protein H0H81_000987 [Sphagnurus paluster]|uniref:RNA polymerase III subunit Rpc25 domain-containing protein n=1 Tax=Sphagnurus paluster TaxID=117069 RepID=A0A9P7GN85_9AGAR|nr:hypothetical protein H0H81_000987 [Sphagnurus paluster]